MLVRKGLLACLVACLLRVCKFMQCEGREWIYMVKTSLRQCDTAEETNKGSGVPRFKKSVEICTTRVGWNHEKEGLQVNRGCHCHATRAHQYQPYIMLATSFLRLSSFNSL